MSDNIVTEELDYIEYCEGNGQEEINIPIGLAIDRLVAVRDSIPNEFRESAVLRIWTVGDYASAYLKVRYVRPKTEEELDAERKASEAYAAERDKRERREYARLTQKYGPHN